MKNKRIIFLLISIGGLFILGLFFINSNKIKNENLNSKSNLIVKNNINGGEKNKENLSQTSRDIAIEMKTIIDKLGTEILNNEGEEGQIYKLLEENYFYNYRHKINISNIGKYIKDNKRTEKQLEIFVFDYNKKVPIEGVDIYIWGLWIGKTDKNGNLHKNITLPKDLSFYYMQVHKKGYIGGFKYIYNVVNKKKEINYYIELKETLHNIGKYNNINIKNEKFKMVLTGDCNFVTKNKLCYKGEVQTDIGYISPQEIEELGIPMKATNYDSNEMIFDLSSAGMNFIEFYDNNGNILEYTGKNKVKICHYISPEKQDEIKKNINEIKQKGLKIGFEDIWNYWWFDKNKGIWVPGIDAIKSIDGNYQCYLTVHIY